MTLKIFKSPHHAGIWLVYRGDTPLGSVHQNAPPRRHRERHTSYANRLRQQPFVFDSHADILLGGVELLQIASFIKKREEEGSP